MRSLVARAQQTLIIWRHETHVMNVTAVKLAWCEAERFVAWLRLGSLLVIVPAVMRYHGWRRVGAMNHILLGSERVCEFS